jgi:anaerobic magnesium-protoporphyrin IX monomethyl ester cyclase
VRVVLVLPPAIEPVRSPLLAFAYLVAALRARGHDALVVDAAAPTGPRDGASLREAVVRARPDLIGVHLKTLEVQSAYGVASDLSDLGVPLVAGGPHATVCAEEALRNGFDLVLRGEAEASLPELADALAGKAPLGDIRGLSFSDRGIVRHCPERASSADLDGLPDPLSALDAFEPAAYGTTGTAVPAGLLSSRGCPAACTFCANNVTGRKFRFHSASRVAREASRLVRDLGRPAFAFFDDSFAVGGARMRKLCEALEGTGARWTCTAHPAHLDRDVLVLMQRAGCGGVDIGLESGDPEMLRVIGKGVTTERAQQVLEWMAELGLHGVVNLMMGWPDETERQLEHTLDFIERTRPFAGGFNARGVLVPHPGTEIYDRYHQRFGFTEWWLREAPIAYERFPTEWSLDEVSRAYASDAALERNFFRHSGRHLELMAEILRRKSRYTFERVLEWSRSAEPKVTVPAAGAR